MAVNLRNEYLLRCSQSQCSNSILRAFFFDYIPFSAQRLMLSGPAGFRFELVLSGYPAGRHSDSPVHL